MAAFVAMGKWTDESVHNVKHVMNRTEAAKQLAESLCGRFIGIWWTMGKAAAPVENVAPQAVHQERI